MSKLRDPQKEADCMADVEVIKALRCKALGEMRCMSCAYYGRYPDCDRYAARNALALLNRQKAEIEILSQNRANIFEIVKAHDKGRAEAVVEFEDRLKELYSDSRYDRPNAHTLLGVLFKNVGNIAREMLGDMVYEKPKVDGGKL